MSTKVKKHSDLTPDEAKPGGSGTSHSSVESDLELTHVYEDVPFIPRFAPDDLSTTFRRRNVMFSSDESD